MLYWGKERLAGMCREAEVNELNEVHHGSQWPKGGENVMGMLDVVQPGAFVGYVGCIFQLASEHFIKQCHCSSEAQCANV
jgi:hypothetical protein